MAPDKFSQSLDVVWLAAIFIVSIGTPDSSQPSRVQVAQGGFAIGDRADGLLFAAGGLARGLIAIGAWQSVEIAIGGLAMAESRWGAVRWHS
jgi:hypothetical protein